MSAVSLYEKGEYTNQPVCSRFPAHNTDQPFVSLAVEFQLFSVLLTLPVYLDRLGGRCTGPQTLQVVQFGHQVLHQVVFGERPLVEHLRGKKQGNLRSRSFCSFVQRVFIVHYSIFLISAQTHS